MHTGQAVVSSPVLERWTNNGFALSALTLLFFMWGVIGCLNDTLIAHLTLNAGVQLELPSPCGLLALAERLQQGPPETQIDAGERSRIPRTSKSLSARLRN